MQHLDFIIKILNHPKTFFALMIFCGGMSYATGHPLHQGIELGDNLAAQIAVSFYGGFYLFGALWITNIIYSIFGLVKEVFNKWQANRLAKKENDEILNQYTNSPLATRFIIGYMSDKSKQSIYIISETAGFNELIDLGWGRFHPPNYYAIRNNMWGMLHQHRPVIREEFEDLMNNRVNMGREIDNEISTLLNELDYRN